LRNAMGTLRPRELEAWELVRGTRLETVHLELSLRSDGRKQKFALMCPLVIEPRWASDAERFVIGYHPGRQEEWFPVYEDGDQTLLEQATAYFTKAWATLTETELDALRLKGKHALKSFSFSIEPRSLLEDLPSRPKGIWDDLNADDRTREGGKK